MQLLVPQSMIVDNLINPKARLNTRQQSPLLATTAHAAEEPWYWPKHVLHQ